MTGAATNRPTATPKENHQKFLKVFQLLPVGKVGREETFTGVLVATLLNPTAQVAMLQGLALPACLKVKEVLTAVQPVDFVLVGHDASGDEHICVGEVKWNKSPGNAPGSSAYKNYPRSQPRAAVPRCDRAPSQLDRAHQLVMAHIHGKPSPCRCGFPQPCAEDGCPRGCSADPAGDKAETWTEWPKEYPFRDNGYDLRRVITSRTRKKENWHFRFLDYSDWSATEAFAGTCNSAWDRHPAPMSKLAAVLQNHYRKAVNGEKRDIAFAHSLEPLLRFLYSD